jgi:hypothetical protein
MRSALLALAVLSAVAAPAHAQREARHQGFWIGFGIGGGSNMSDEAAGVRAGGAAYVRLGGTLSQSVLLGGEISAWARSIEGSTVSRANMNATMMLYPMRNGLFVKAGAGFATWMSSSSSGGTTISHTDGGFGGSAGLGYELQIGGNLFLSPNVDFAYQRVESEFFSNTNGYLLLFTLGLTWH